MVSWPADLVEDIARRRCVLFLGAGISKSSTNANGERPKDWEEFLYHAANSITDASQRKEVDDCLASKDLLTACELARRFLRPELFKSTLLSEFSSKRFRASTVHDTIVHLDSRFVLTTNFDKLYENQANQVMQNTVLVKHYYDDDVADVLRRTERCVLKVHGTIDAADKTIFTRSDYATARVAYARFHRLMEALFLTHTFVFLGASMRDPDIQLLLEDYAYRFEGTRPHYVVMPNGAVAPGTLQLLEEAMNLRVLQYSPADNHRELGEALARLAELVDEQRNSLLSTNDW